MKKIVLLFAWILLCVTMGFAQGIRFETGTWNEMLAKAKAENKVIFVDVYTQWCGPCKLVAKNVFPDKSLGRVYNETFINYKLDAETPEGKKFIEKYPISGVPTFYYIDAEGKVMNQVIGAKDVAGFINEAEMVEMYKRHGGLDNMKNAIKNGTATKEMLHDYYITATPEVKPIALNLYLKSLSTEELLDPEKTLVGNIALYDKDLMFHLADELIKISHSDKFSDKDFVGKFNFSVTFPIHYIIGTFFTQSINQGNLKWFNELLELKEKYADFNGWVLDGDWIIRSGRGLFFATPEYLKLCYATNNRIAEDKFKPAMINYMTKLMAEKPVGTLLREDEKASWKIAKEEGIKKQPMAADYFFPKGGITAQNIIKWTNYFWRISPSDKKTKQLCSEWINYAFNMNPYNTAVAVPAAIWLARMGNIKNGIEILEMAIAKQKEMKNDDAKLYRYLEINLQDLKNKKI